MSTRPPGRWVSNHGHMEFVRDDDHIFVREGSRPPAAAEPAPEPAPDIATTPGYVADDYEPIARRRNTAGGWTAERQRAFLSALAQTGSVVQAAEAAGISARSAYRLRAHPEGERFAAAWAAAVMSATRSLLATAFERATDGPVRRVWRGGRIVRERGAPSDRMLMFLLGNLLPKLFGRGVGVEALRRGQEVGGFEAMLDTTLDALVDVDLEAEPFGADA